MSDKKTPKPEIEYDWDRTDPIKEQIDAIQHFVKGKVAPGQTVYEALLSSLKGMAKANKKKDNVAKKPLSIFSKYLKNIEVEKKAPGVYFFTEEYKPEYQNDEEAKKEVREQLNTIMIHGEIAMIIGDWEGFSKVFLKKYKELSEREEELEKREKALSRRERRPIQVAIHGVSQFFGDNKQLSLFSDEKIEAFKNGTGISLVNNPTGYGVVLNQAQSRVFEGILKAFSDSNYRGDEEASTGILEEIYEDSNDETRKILIEQDGAPYQNIDKIPIVRLTQAQIIELSGYDLKKQRQGDKQDVVEALSFLATTQFCFYWVRLKTKDGKPVKNKKGDYEKEEVMEVGTLLRIKTIRNETGILQYYEIHPSAPLLDQVTNYFLLLPANWREEVKEITGKNASSYTYHFLLWLRLQYEHIRRFNSSKAKGRRKKPLQIKTNWEEVAKAIKMPESVYKRNKATAKKKIDDAYSVAIEIGYLKKVEKNGYGETLFLNEEYYPKPGELR